MDKKWLIKLGTPVFALSLVTACADDGDQNPPPEEDAPAEEIQDEMDDVVDPENGGDDAGLTNDGNGEDQGLTGDEGNAGDQGNLEGNTGDQGGDDIGTGLENNADDNGLTDENTDANLNGDDEENQ